MINGLRDMQWEKKFALRSTHIAISQDFITPKLLSPLLSISYRSSHLQLH